MSATIFGTDVDIPLPTRRLRLMGDSDERFVDEAIWHAKQTYRLGLRDDHWILDVGCNTGRLAIGLLAGTEFSGRYVGFDVMPRHVRWARKSLTPLAPDFHFRHVDVHNDRYNPEGTIQPADLEFPARTGKFDVATLYSIFTHFYAADIAVYLRELHRVLRPGGIVVASWFLYDDDSLERVQSSERQPMVHRLDEDTIYKDLEDPLAAIAFHERAVRALVAEADLELVDIEHGRWKGDAGPAFQDLVILRRKAEATETASSLAQRVRDKAVRKLRP